MVTGFGLQAFGTSAFGLGSELTQDWQFELDGYMFGPGTDVTVAEWTPVDADIRTQDQLTPRGDFRIFGTDYQTPGQWDFELSILRRTPEDALADLAPLRAAWESSVRLTPQAVVAMRYRLAGRTRRVFGRPRRFSPVMSELVFGRVYAVADFALAEPWSYDDLEQSITLTSEAVIPDTPNSFPFEFPFLWGATEGSPRHGQITVGGTRPTWLRAVIEGPAGTSLTDPYVIVAGEVVQLRGAVPSGESIVVSSVPWERGIYRLDGSQAPVTLDPSSRLDQLRVAPGTHTISFGGIDNTGTASCQVAWRDAYTSI